MDGLPGAWRPFLEGRLPLAGTVRAFLEGAAVAGLGEEGAFSAAWRPLADVVALRMAAASTLRTTPLWMKSTPSTMPTGRAVRKLPDTTRTIAFAIGVFGRPCENAASISKRSCPAASCAESRATASVMRRP